MTDRPTAEQLARLRALGAATIYEAQGQRGSIARITPIDPSMKLAGPALTVDAGPGDNLVLHAALQHARPGDVLVADPKGFADAGTWRDDLTVAALEVGIAGTMVHNGDVVVGDRDGVVVIEAGHLDKFLHSAEERADEEASFRKQIAQGVTTVELLGLTHTLHTYFRN